MYTAKEIRSKYLEFFKSKGHAVINSASVIPENDPTVLFTTAGMHPLVPYLLGEPHPAGTRLTDYQKCVRTGDIDAVGDPSHLTCFEMLGNWSLGDYFKKESIAFSYEFLTSPQWLGLDPRFISVTVFEGDENAPRDEEAAQYWKDVGMSEDKIAYLPASDNWWAAGPTGPCGPDTEIFYWVGEGVPPVGSNKATDSDNWMYEDCLHCEHCYSDYAVKELKYMNNKIQCKCGEWTTLSDLRPYRLSDDYHNNREVDMIIHNTMNGTLNKLNVPTIIANEKFYCPECHETHNIYSYKKQGGLLICHCGASYTFDECKLESSTINWTTVGGGLYFDDNKVSISLIKQATDINRFDRYYWTTGNTRATINLKTGFSYQTNSGCCYTEFNKSWQRYRNDNTKAPKLFNATYNTFGWEQLNELAVYRLRELQVKYVNYPNIVRLIQKRKYAFINAMKVKLFKQIDEYVTNYYNTKLGLSYRIKSLSEIVTNYDCSVSFAERINFDALHLFVLHNRFLNANYNDLIRNLSIILSNTKFLNLNKGSKVFRKMHRETNCPLIDFISALVPVSKSLRKRILADYTGANSNKLDWSSSLFTFVEIASFFEKKENVNKLYDIFAQTPAGIHVHEDFMPIWTKLRSEEYIANLELFEELRDKVYDMIDVVRLIRQIKYVYGEDWTCTVAFHNEKQYHDALVTITRSR